MYEIQQVDNGPDLPDENQDLPNETQALPDANQDLPDEKQELPDKDQTNEGDLPDKANVLSDESTNLPDIEQIKYQEIVVHDKDDSQNNITEVATITLPTVTIDTTKDKFICNSTADHRCDFLTEKDNSQWSKPNGMYGGVRCQGENCGKLFVDKIVNPGNEFKASVRKPMHVCANKKLYCTFGYCHECYLKAMGLLNN
jgi:hypothetical protein